MYDGKICGIKKEKFYIYYLLKFVITARFRISLCSSSRYMWFFEIKFCVEKNNLIKIHDLIIINDESKISIF